jgi:hypothetical protein
METGLRRSMSLLASLTILVPLATARAAVFLDHAPDFSNGSGSDTGWNDIFGNHYWQQTADDFQLSSPVTLSTVAWYACYGDDLFSSPPPHPPSGNETIRIRLYNARPSDGLPGPTLYEETFVNPSRVATGRHVGLPTFPTEYRFQATLSTTVQLQASEPYWLEIAQIDDNASLFRWETSSAPGGPFAVINEHLEDWNYVPGANHVSFQLMSVPEPALFLSIVPYAIVFLRLRGRREGQSPSTLSPDRKP